jgi:hypothetical protein
VSSPAFAHGHQHAAAAADAPKPVSTHSELWSYDIANI